MSDQLALFGAAEAERARAEAREAGGVEGVHPLLTIGRVLAVTGEVYTVGELDDSLEVTTVWERVSVVPYLMLVQDQFVWLVRWAGYAHPVVMGMGGAGGDVDDGVLRD